MKLPSRRFRPGKNDDITDVAGVRVNHVTIIQDEPKVVRTGVTAIVPLDVDYWEQSVFAGVHSFNGFGEMMGTHWIREVGILSSPICLSSTFSLGVVRDAMLIHPFLRECRVRFHQPIGCETNDAFLSDRFARPVTREHVIEAIDGVRQGPVAAGNVGGGTGMIAYGFKAGIGSASRIAETITGKTYVVGALVQANHGDRKDLVIEGVPIGRALDAIPLPKGQAESEGSIIVVLATDAPLLPTQCERLAKHAVAGLGRVGCYGANTSGDLIIAFSTANRVSATEVEIATDLEMLPNQAMNEIFLACNEAIQGAIANSLFAATTMVGRDGNTAWALPRDLALEILGESHSTHDWR